MLVTPCMSSIFKYINLYIYISIPSILLCNGTSFDFIIAGIPALSVKRGLEKIIHHFEKAGASKTPF